MSPKEPTTKSIYYWGDPSRSESLPQATLRFLKEEFQVSLEDIPTPLLQKSFSLADSMPKSLEKKLLSFLSPDQISKDPIDRARHSLGRTYAEILLARGGVIRNPVLCVLRPKNESEVAQVLSVCQKEKISVVPFGGGSSVTGALAPSRKAISLDMSLLCQVLEFKEKDHSVRVQAGITGPDLEAYLNSRGFTCGHFPQSFEFSTVGGWIAGKGAGQASTGYGKMEEILLSITVITPRGTVKTKDYPAASIGPDIFRLFLGSEGVFGVITEATLKVRKWNPKNSSKQCFVFHDFFSGLEAMREVMQAGFGKPHFFRLQDPEETQIAFKMSGKEGSLSDRFLQLIGYMPMKRSLMHVIIEGDPDYTRFVMKKVKAVVKKYKAFSAGEGPVNKWLEQRYSSAYLRDALMDKGIRIDTLETAVTWEKIYKVWESVRNHIKSFPMTSSLVHISHAYETGANLYFIFILPMEKDPKKELDQFVAFHSSIVSKILEAGGSLSHHHGIGKLFAPFLKQELDPTSLSALYSIKKSFDPEGIMNPGSLGLD